jgi:mono/diheme cytochrome c family protein
MRRSSLHPTLLPLLAIAAAASTAAGCFGFNNENLPDELPPSNLEVSPVPPPAISGGTLLVTKDGRAIAADPDRDAVWIVNLDNHDVARVNLNAGDEPGRVVEDAAGRVHVALRRGGALVTIDTNSASIVARRNVCAAPRGVAYDGAKDVVHVACESGELATFPAAGGDAVRVLRLPRDLRDVVVNGDHLVVTRFRSAEVLNVDANGALLGEATKLPTFTDNYFGNQYEPGVAWRAVKTAGGVAVVHQRGLLSTVLLSPGGYYSTAGCDGNIVHGAVSVVRSPFGAAGGNEAIASAALPQATLPVDIAITADDSQITVAAAGANKIFTMTRESVEASIPVGVDNCAPPATATEVPGEPIGVAYRGGDVVAQIRQPAAIFYNGTTITLTTDEADARGDTAHHMFHHAPGSGAIACASCHPEGHEDGRVWKFDIGDRRTQNIGIGGGLMDTAPFHWNGDLQDMNALMGEVFVKRMGGQLPGPRSVRMFKNWLDQLPALVAPPARDANAATRGKAVFEDATVACASCHTGGKLTNNKTVDVGTGGQFQVPSLIGVSSRAPLMHDGCAKTLAGRFDGTCGGGELHGKTAHLSKDQVDDLVAYLETL